MDLISLALLGFGASKLIKAKKTADALEYYPKNLHYKQGKFYFYMDVLNPTNNPLKVDSFFGGVYIGDTKVGSIEQGNPITYQAKKRTEEQFPIMPIGSGFATVVQKIIAGEGKKLTFKIVGVARSMGINNPINEELKLS